MADDSVADKANQDGKDPSGSTSDAGAEFNPITSQADLDKIVGERVARERAKFADYRDLKSKAARLDEIEAANKSELEKAAEARQQAEQERDAARAEALRFKVASKHGISDEDAELFLTGSDEDTLTRQAERLAAATADAGKPRPPKPDTNQGRNGPGAGMTTAQQFAVAIGDALNH